MLHKASVVFFAAAIGYGALAPRPSLQPCNGHWVNVDGILDLVCTETSLCGENCDFFSVTIGGMDIKFCKCPNEDPEHIPRCRTAITLTLNGRFKSCWCVDCLCPVSDDDPPDLCSVPQNPAGDQCECALIK